MALDEFDVERYLKQEKEENYEDGYEEGLGEGFKKGIQEGTHKGKAEGKDLMFNLMSSISQKLLNGITDNTVLAEECGITTEEVKQIRAGLGF